MADDGPTNAGTESKSRGAGIVLLLLSMIGIYAVMRERKQP